MGENRKKIYITSLHLLHGGIEMAITLLANALVKRGCDVEILCLYDLGKPVYDLEKEVKVTYLTKVQPNREEFLRAVKERKIFSILLEGMKACYVLYLKRHAMKVAIKNIREGTVIATRTEHAVCLSKYGKKEIRKIAQLHHDHRFDKKLLHDFAENYDNIDVFVVLTELLKKEIGDIMKDNQHTQLYVIPNFLPETTGGEIRERKNQIVTVGRLHEVKGFLRMLDIWKEASEERDIVLKIIGEGEERNDIENKIRELGLEKKVILCGALEHKKVLEEMEQSLVYIMTSLSEAFPFVLIEAMSSGLPIIAYDVRVGPRAIIKDEVNGYLVKDGDKETFIEKLREMLDDTEKNQRMSEWSKRLAVEFSEEKVVQEWLSIL